MVLIFGGVYQGKLDYALNRFMADENDIYRCCAADTAMPANKKIIYEIDKWILALVKIKADVPELLQKFIKANAESVVICNDISCGVVPVDSQMRIWREATGRAITGLSQVSTEVVRMFCGIPARLK